MTKTKHKADVKAERPAPLGYSVPEAAQASSLGQTSIYKAIKEKKLKARKFGSRTIIKPVDLEAFLEALPAT